MCKSVFVIVVTWNGMKWIKRCLDALHESSYPVKTVVIDNGSTDDTVSFIRDNYPEVHLVESGKNLGFGQANNEGMRYALANGCDYVYLLNQDAYVYPDMFQLLIDEAEKTENQEKYAIYSPLHINGNVNKMDKQFKEYLNDIASTIVEDQYLSTPDSIYAVKGVPAAGWLLPRITLDTIGGFDPLFFHYGEDVNYFQRVNYHGKKTAIVLNAKMIHDRVDFGNMSAYKKGKVRREIETYILLGINLKSFRIIGLIIKKYFGYLRLLFLFKPIYFYESVKFLPVILFCLRKYLKSRKSNKTVRNNWLW